MLHSGRRIDAFPDLLAPTHAHAEVKRAFARLALQLVERVERDFALARAFEILACVKPGFERSSADIHIGMDELVAYMVDSEYLQQTVDHDLVYAFMPDYSVLDIVIRKLVIGFVSADIVVRLQKRSCGF